MSTLLNTNYKQDLLNCFSTRNSRLKGIYRTHLSATILRLIRKRLPYCGSTGWRVTAIHQSTALIFGLHM